MRGITPRHYVRKLANPVATSNFLRAERVGKSCFSNEKGICCDNIADTHCRNAGRVAVTGYCIHAKNEGTR